MMTVLELINALEDQRGDYDDPVIIINPVIGRGEVSYVVERLEYSAAPAFERDVGGGHMRLVVSRYDAS